MDTSISRPRFLIWMVWSIASIFYAYQYLLRVMPNILLQDIMQRFDIDTTTIGQFSGIYYIGYSLLHLPIGILLDRFGPKRILSLCILLTVAGLSPLLWSPHFIVSIIGRFLIGLGSSAAILGIFKVIRLYFPEKIFSRMLSFSVMIGLIGAIYGGGPLDQLRASLGFDGIVWLLGGLGCALSIFTYLLLPDHQETNPTPLFSELFGVLKNRSVFLCCFFAGCMVGPLEGFADVWGTIFLKHVQQIDPTTAASLPSFIFIGMCFGSPFLSLIAEKIGTLRTIFASALLMAISFILLVQYTLPTFVIGALFLVIGFASAYQILAIYQASTYVSPKNAGVTTAMANMIIMAFGYLFHTLIGTTVSWAGGPTSALALSYGILVLPAALLIGAAGFFSLFLQQRSAIQTAEKFS